MTTIVYVTLFLATTLYAVILDRYGRRWYTWAQVVAGVALVLAAPFTMRQFGMITSAADYETAVWNAFLVGGGPIIAWQVGQHIANLYETVEYRMSNETETLAKQCRGNAGRSGGAGAGTAATDQEGA